MGSQTCLHLSYRPRLALLEAYLPWSSFGLLSQLIVIFIILDRHFEIQIPVDANSEFCYRQTISWLLPSTNKEKLKILA
jgi:hypothetical protein